jgi:hypothetical protein
MPLDRKMSNAAVNAEANALATLANNGYIRLYTGAKPATADTAITAQVLVSTLRFGATAFPAASNGVLTANPITKDSSAVGNASPVTWARILQSDGSTVLWDDTVGTSDSNIVLNSVTIGAGAEVSITSLTHTIPKA